MSSSHPKKKSDMRKRQGEGGIWEDKLGRDTNKPKVCQKSRPIYKITWTN